MYDVAFTMVHYIPYHVEVGFGVERISYKRMSEFIEFIPAT